MNKVLSYLSSVSIEHLNAFVSLGGLAVAGFAVFAIYNLAKKGDQK